MGVPELCPRERQLETAAGFTRTLVRDIDDLNVSAAGQALAVLAERQANGNGAAVPLPANTDLAVGLNLDQDPPPLDDAVMRALAAELGIDGL